MKTSQLGIDLIKNFEGCKLAAYKDIVGVPTIGYGSTLGVKMGDVITQAQAEDLLVEDLAPVEIAINSLVKVPLNQNQFDALASFVFNLGRRSLELSTLLRLINRGQFKNAADEFDRWVRAGGVVSQGLVKRRAKEKMLFLS